MKLSLKSPAFENGGRIPDRYARAGANAPPPLAWDGAPEGTRSFALLVEDPDAPSGMFRHWAVYDIPADRTNLSDGEDLNFPQGVNDFGHDHYDGPEPPPGHGVHHYHFRLAALDTDRLDDAQDGVSAGAVWDKALRHVIEETEIIGTYETAD